MLASLVTRLLWIPHNVGSLGVGVQGCPQVVEVLALVVQLFPPLPQMVFLGFQRLLALDQLLFGDAAQSNCEWSSERKLCPVYAEQARNSPRRNCDPGGVRCPRGKRGRGP